MVNENLNIEDMIYKVRGQYVMLDSDLARLFGYTTKRINENIKNNFYKFSENMVSKIEHDEFNVLKSKISTSKDSSSALNTHGGSRKGHLIFTKEGIKILSTILKKSNVPKVTEKIIKTFEKVVAKNDRALVIPVSKGDLVHDLIYEINGVPVNLDIDLARLYGCKNGTKEINQAVKNNIEKFPESYSWVLSNEELQILRSTAMH